MNDFQKWLISQGYYRKKGSLLWYKGGVLCEANDLHKKLREFKNKKMDTELSSLELSWKLHDLKYTYIRNFDTQFYQVHTKRYGQRTSVLLHSAKLSDVIDWANKTYYPRFLKVMIPTDSSDGFILERLNEL